ncbi:MAG: hypothetical protein PHE84_11355 [bacterium]|nr:hypothetical protein [bacterium]
MELPNKEWKAPGNNAPVIPPIAPVIVNEGDLIEIQPQVSDPDPADILTISFRGWAPQGYSVDVSDPTRPIWRYQTGYSDAGDYSISVVANDGTESGTVRKDILISVKNVNRAPICPTIASQTVAELAELQLTFRASDPDPEDNFNLSYAFGWQGQMPAGVTNIVVDPLNDNASFSFTPDFDSRGNYVMEFSVTDASVPTYTVNCPIPLKIEDILYWEKAGDLPSWLSQAVVNSLAVDPYSSQVYAGFSSFYDPVSNPVPDQGYGVYAYSPLGNSWADISTGLSELRVLDLRSKTGTSQVYMFAATTAGIFRYDGISWHEMSSGIPSKYRRIFSLELDSQEKIWAGPGSGLAIGTGILGPLYFSNDDAQTWVYSNGITDLIRVFDLASGGTHMLASVFRKSGNAYFNAIIQSLDLGVTWEDNSFFGHLSSPSRVITFDPADSQKIYVGVDNQGLYRTVDGGTTWLLPILIGTTNSYPRAILPIADPDYPGTVLVGLTEKGIWRSRDGGATFTAQNQGLPDGAAIRSIAVDPNNLDRIYVGTEYHGVYRTKTP